MCTFFLLKSNVRNLEPREPGNSGTVCLLKFAGYDGTLIFVSHDREFVSSLATRVIEIRDQGMTSFQGSYDEYLASQLDIPRVA